MGKESSDSCDFEPDIDPGAGGGTQGRRGGCGCEFYNRATNIDRKKNPGKNTGTTK